MLASVDDPENVEPGNETSVFGGLKLRVVEVSGGCDDGLLDGLADERLGRLAHLRQDR